MINLSELVEYGWILFRLVPAACLSPMACACFGSVVRRPMVFLDSRVR